MTGVVTGKEIQWEFQDDQIWVNFITTSTSDRTLEIMVSILEIIPFDGRTIQVSEISSFIYPDQMEVRKCNRAVFKTYPDQMEVRKCNRAVFKTSVG